MSEAFPMVPLREILVQTSRPETVEPDKIYRILGTHWYAGGLYIKETKLGTEIQADKVYHIEQGDFVYNRLFAWKGSFAVATAKDNGCYVSNEFPSFSINRHKVSAQYLQRYFCRASVWDEALGLSNGGTPTSRNRLKEDKLLSIRIPLPPLEEQQRILARIEEFVAKIEKARRSQREAMEKVEVLSRQAYELAWIEAEKRSSHLSLLEQLADVIDPQPDHRTPAALIGGMPYVSIANISMNGTIDVLGARKVSPDAVDRQEASFTLKTGDIVLGKIGTIGAARPILVKERFALSANVVLVQPYRDKILDRLLLNLLRSSQAEKQFIGGTRTSAQGAFGIKKMRKLLIPLPPLSIQQKIVTNLDALQSKAEILKRIQTETSVKLDAMLPSILDKAFKGEL